MVGILPTTGAEGSVGRSPVCGCKPRLYQSDLLKLWASAENAAVGKSFQMPVLRSGVRPRPQCCGKHFGIGAAIPGYQPLEAHDFSRGSSHRGPHIEGV